MKIDIIDIGIGNIRSIQNWLEKSNIPYNRVIFPENISSNLVILPGVGSAKLYNKNLREKRFDKAIIKHLADGGRLIGICLGFQILFDFLDEDGGVEGLGILKGKVERLITLKSHTGWEDFEFNKGQLSKLWITNQFSKSRKKILKGRVFYNHNYGVIALDENIINTKIPKLDVYSSYTISKQIIGFQFHPEKSQITGQTLIELIY